MAELGQTREGAQLIPGDASAIDENVVAIRGRGKAMTNAGDGLKKINSGAWIGAAGDAFRNHFSYEPGRWFDAGDAFETTAAALSDYAGTLRWAQGQAAEAIRLWDEGQDATQQAKVAYDQAVADAAGGPTAMPPFFDPGEEKRQAARDTLEEARRQLSDAGNRAATTIRTKGDEAPEQSGWDAFWGGVGDVFGAVGDFFGGVWDGAVELVTGLGALIGRDPTTGEWSWETAGASWKGLGTFALAVAVYATPGGALLDQTTGVLGLERGQLGDTLLTAGKSIIAYDEWGKDPARAAGKTTFNIVSAVLGTKGAGATLRGTGAAAQSSRVAAVSAVGTSMVRTGDFIGRLPTVSGLVERAAERLPGLGRGATPSAEMPREVEAPRQVDVPAVPADLPRSVRTPDFAPAPGTIGDALARTPDSSTGGPSTPGAELPASRGVDPAPTHSTADTAEVPNTSSTDRTPALVGADADSFAPTAHTSTGSGTDIPSGHRPDADGGPHGYTADSTPDDASHGNGDRPDSGSDSSGDHSSGSDSSDSSGSDSSDSSGSDSSDSSGSDSSDSSDSSGSDSSGSDSSDSSGSDSSGSDSSDSSGSDSSDSSGSDSSGSDSSGDWLYEPSDAEQALQAGRVVDTRLLDPEGHANDLYRMTFDDGTRGAYKPVAGEDASLRQGIPGGLANREVAASRMDEAFGFGRVPTTTFVDGEYGPGSVQRWMEDIDSYLPHDEYPRLQQEQMAVFDYVIGNMDRHLGNYQTDANGNIVAIDHGYAFPESPDPRFGIRSDFVDKNLRVPLSDEVMANVRAVDPDQVRSILRASGLREPAIDGVIARLGEVQARGMIIGEAWPGVINGAFVPYATRPMTNPLESMS